MPRILRRPRLLAATVVVAVVAALGVSLAATAGGDDALVVYNARSHYGDEEAFRLFEQRTGIDVQLRGGSATELYERLTNEGEDTPADVLVTVDAANLWRAESAGLLAPVKSPVVARNIPAELRDPGDRWVAISRRVRTLMRSTERVRPGEIARYEDLGDARWKRRVCLRTSNNIYNQSLVADMIAKRGRAATERTLRAWMANEPRFLGSDVDVLKAIGAGRCDVGLTNHYYLARILADQPEFPVAPVWADQDGDGAHVNLSGAAVVAHSEDRPAALRLVEFLTTPAAQRSVRTNGELPANPQVEPVPHVADWTGFDTSPIDVDDAGRHQDDALRLMAEVGWE
jgi:iron(III) transport system substrate-binding protein